ncbi:MAG: sensor histidine kinase N-terminal domain-containing protein [Parvibaculum sp.]|nr:sensor histidine kinase N-terminal domain-containing protein [Parvibaculum sp.]
MNRMFRALGSNSLEARLNRRMIAIVLLVFAFLLLILKVQYEAERDTLRDRSLLAQAADVAAHVTVTGDGVSLSLPPNLDDAYDRPDRQFVYLIVDREGRVLTSSHGQQALLAPLPEAGSDPYFSLPDLAGRGTYYGVTASLGRGETPALYVQVAQGSLHEDVLADSLVEEFLERSWHFLLLFGIGVITVTVWTVRQSLAPVTALSHLARRIGPANLDRRLPEEGLPLEILPLVQSVNRSLDRIEEGYRRERDFTANAAHELRTPLAVLKANIETMSGLEEVPQLLQELGGLERLVTQLLRLSQADNLVLQPGETADLHDVARAVAEQLAPLALAAGKSIALSGDGPLPVHGNADFLGLALRNLAENALAHTPRGEAVEIRVGPGPAVTVIDRGPGLQPGEEGRIFERFFRGRGDAYAGAGLGLSIARRIAVIHGGSIETGQEGGKGAAFTLRLPELPQPRPL